MNLSRTSCYGNELYIFKFTHPIFLFFPVGRYRLRSKVEIENVGQEFSCWQRYGGNLSKAPPHVEEPEAASVGWGSGVDRAAMLSSRGNNHGWQWFKDPRLDCLGFRGIFPSNTTREILTPSVVLSSSVQTKQVM